MPLAVAVLAGSCAAALAAAPGPIEARVEQAAREHLRTHAQDAGLLKPSVAVTLLPRGEVPACTQDVEVEALDIRRITRMRFAATCSTPAGRAEFIVRGAITAEVVVTASDLKAGQSIEMNQLALERRDISAAPDAMSDPQQIVGRSSRRALRSGQIVERRWLVEPILVKRGAKVNIVARNVGVEVHVAGVALQAGRRDEIIEVRNNANGNVIRARVVGENSVEPAGMALPSAAE